MAAVFIRAPKIERAGKTVKILAEFDGAPVLVSERNILASNFHSELDNDTRLLKYFTSKFLPTMA